MKILGFLYNIVFSFLMLRAVHPEVLAQEWIPPVALGRRGEVERVVRLLEHHRSTKMTGPAALVVGPAGAGSSTVVRLAARQIVDQLRCARQPAPPLVAAVRVRYCRGTLGVASELLRRLDPEFEGRGFRVVEIIAGFVRRLARDSRAGVVILDDLGPSSPDLAPILRALLSPGRFLPEGVDTPPRLWTLAAGSFAPGLGGGSTISRFVGPDRTVALEPYTAAELEVIVRDRAERALNRPPPDDWIRSIVHRAIREGSGPVKALEVVRRDLLEPQAIRPGGPFGPQGKMSEFAVEPRVVEAIERASDGDCATVGEVRRWEAISAREQGVRPLPATTFWRRVIRLEQAGLVRREVRTGGPGGTRSLIRLLDRASADRLTIRVPTDNHPIVGAGGGPAKLSVSP